MDTKQPAIQVKHLYKSFKLPHEKNNSLKGLFVGAVTAKRTFEKQHVLKDISFTVPRGEFFGILGRNGSGKSTLLKLLAGIYAADEGEMVVNGSLAPFIELGVGFNPELTGRENVFLNGALLGFDRKQMSGMYKEIVDFAGIERFMDQKLKNYSSGMQVRLAFSIAIRAETDILLVDEVLAVGDAAFQSKCLEYFSHLKKIKKTVVFISHDVGVIEEYCDSAILIDSSEMIIKGDVRKVVARYNEMIIDRRTQELSDEGQDTKELKEKGNHQVEITKAVFELNKKVQAVFRPGQKIDIRVNYKANLDTESPVFGLVVRKDGIEVPLFATNTKVDRVKVPDLKKGQEVEYLVSIVNNFGEGRFSISPAVASTDTRISFDWKDDLMTFYSNGWDNKMNIFQTDYETVIKQ